MWSSVKHEFSQPKVVVVCIYSSPFRNHTPCVMLSHLYLMMRFGKLTIQENKATPNQASSFVILLW
ncbi:hypothetical protein HanPSC8_Chr11g0458831 [Helianthus annuus]|nr:hypothetical protein HanPSC8_Chr11g0458831 [Helianthus annuus]